MAPTPRKTSSPLFEDDCCLALAFLTQQCACGPEQQAAIDRIKGEGEYLRGLREESPYSSHVDDADDADEEGEDDAP